MKPILQALGYFALFVTLYIVTTIVTIFLMSFATVAIVPGVFICTGVLTIALSIVAAVMSYQYWEEETKRHEVENTNDHDYRMELLRIAEEQNRGLEEAPLQLQVESQIYQSSGTS